MDVATKLETVEEVTGSPSAVTSDALEPSAAEQPAPTGGSKRVRMATPEFWRFAFTVFVCLYHLEIFFVQRKLFLNGSSAVEFFFILAGFLMAMSAKHKTDALGRNMTAKEAHSAAVDYARKKLIAIWPLLLITVLLGTFVYPSTDFPSKLKTFQNSEWELLLLVGTPFGFNNGMAPNIPLWFLTALMVVGYIYTFLICKNYEIMTFAAPAIGILGYIFFTLNSNMMIDHTIEMGFLNAGSLHAVAEMALGIALFTLYEYLSRREYGVISRVLLSLLEVYAIFRFMQLTIGQGIALDNFRKIVWIMVIILLSFLNVTAFAKVMNNVVSRLLGDISLAMYLCHYQLITVYFRLLGEWKTHLGAAMRTDPAAKAMLNLISNTGGYGSGWKSIPMSWMDCVLYLVLVIVVAVAMRLLVALIRECLWKPARRRFGREGIS